MESIILSIKPKYIEKIISGEKRVEYRKILFKNDFIKKVYVYASNPVKKIVGEFEIDYILKGNLEEIWEKTKDFSGVTREEFFAYFSGKTEANVIFIKNFVNYDEKNYKNIKDFCGKSHPPQNFYYLEK